ncbi:DUF7576 family protein [Halostagnicola bangensis]
MISTPSPKSIARCEHCGSVIDTTEWHPAVIEPDGDARVQLFCGPTCRQQWDPSSVTRS